MSVTTFENARWSGTDQSLEFRHHAALSLIPEGTILDLGCGDGLTLELLRAAGREARGADVSEEAIRKCHEKGLLADRCDLSEPLPYADGSFTTVVLLDVLEHVYDPEMLLKEAARVAQGYVVISVPNFSSLPARIQVLLGRVPENNLPQKGHVYWFNYAVLRCLAKRTGLSVETNRMNTFFPARLLGTLPCKLLPNMFALSYVARLSKKAHT